jgi:hypothetical protein
MNLVEGNLRCVACTTVMMLIVPPAWDRTWVARAANAPHAICMMARTPGARSSILNNIYLLFATTPQCRCVSHLKVCKVHYVHASWRSATGACLCPSQVHQLCLRSQLAKKVLLRYRRQSVGVYTCLECCA